MLFHDWGAKFYFNALVAALIAIGVCFLLEDTPQSRGLPPVEKWRNDYPPGYTRPTRQTLPFREIFLKYVLPNRFLWAIAIANAFCYFVRYGVVNWIPTYLETAKGFSFQRVEHAWALYEFAAIPGTIACGWLSDRWFKGRRAPMTMIFMALTLVAVVAYWMNLRGPAVDRLRRAVRDRLPGLRPDHDDRPALARPRAQESRGHGGRPDRALRLRVRLGHRGHGRRLDRRPLGLERRVHRDGRLLRADDPVRLADTRVTGRRARLA